MSTPESTVLALYRYLDEQAPFSTQLSWDNSGLLVGNPGQEVRSCVFALDVTKEVIDFAKLHHVQLIITHHPVIFSPIKNVTEENLVWQLIRENISVISAHTNLDLAVGGVNDALAEALCLEDVRPFVNADSIGRIGRLHNCMKAADFAEYIQDRLGQASDVAFTACGPVHTVALVGGAGGDYLHEASTCGVDAYLTGELRHHEWMEAQRLPISVYTAGHYATEAVVLQCLCTRFKEKFSGIQFFCCDSSNVMSL